MAASSCFQRRPISLQTWRPTKPLREVCWFSKMISQMKKRSNSGPIGVTITPRLLRTREAAAYLGCSAWKIRRLVQDGALPYIPASEFGAWWFDITDLDQFVETQKRHFDL
jgi:excisionase family DNA binding protein